MTAVGKSGGGGGDVLWVVYKRPLTAEEREKTIGNPLDGIFITAYRAPAGGGAVDMNLHAARNATADFMLTEHAGGPLGVEAVVNRIREEQEQAKAKKRK
ncbi:MAG: hypothetical protein A3F84_02265 [Candidatus Handelsmanbacteria bacterium RIFCSPLOWO2_12_FULL_64_10]|uniref:Uncharacterized protein n=1 Tax=Handelsmanbacteria sp. (strain RIFCSPLOWO2_12_FULL_64_10) TaxID=1817868 RepID=A0A1F6CLQ1_HANXR|nr:MAG: hypothetical protein A3F84_02265 [Candidatus Handelsmanbacteria bacterium RIFCSPLOWO2_12_FULL_64_10]